MKPLLPSYRKQSDWNQIDVCSFDHMDGEHSSPEQEGFTRRANGSSLSSDSRGKHTAWRIASRSHPVSCSCSLSERVSLQIDLSSPRANIVSPSHINRTTGCTVMITHSQGLFTHLEPVLRSEALPATASVCRRTGLQKF